MGTIELTDKLTAELVDHLGNELTIVNAARVSLNQHSDELLEADKGLIGFLMKNRHASPFEHCVITFRISAPIFVAREWHRHRTQSFNEVSGRYTQLKPKFYAPSWDRPLKQVGKPGAYKFNVGTDQEMMAIHREVRFAAQTAWDAYEFMLDEGVAKEVARIVLPVNIYTEWYATANLRNWLGFLSLRTDEQAMYEIRDLAFQIEHKLFELFPTTMEAWDRSSRGSL